MKQILFKAMGGVLFGLSLVFSSCGNLDNPLEEIGKNSTAVALSGALEEGAEVSFTFKYVAGEIETPIQVNFKRKGDKFTFIDADYQIPENIDEEWAEDIEELLEDLLSEENVDEIIKLEYDKANNQLNASFVYPNIPRTRNELGEEVGDGDDVAMPLLTVVFEISNNKYTQYVYPSEGFFIWAGVSVNGEDKTNLLSTDYSKMADFYYKQELHGGNARAFSRTRAQDDEYLNFFRVYYKDGETWADVNKRYKEKAGNPLLVAYGESEWAEEGDGDALDEDVAVLYLFGQPFALFAYYGNYDTDEDFEANLVKTKEKVGYKADGSTANSDGYLFDLAD